MGSIFIGTFEDRKDNSPRLSWLSTRAQGRLGGVFDPLYPTLSLVFSSPDLVRVSIGLNYDGSVRKYITRDMNNENFVICRPTVTNMMIPYPVWEFFLQFFLK